MQLPNALHQLAMQGEWEAVSILVEKGWDVNAVDDGGRTPILMSATRRNAKTFNLLLSLGARVDLVDKHGTTLLHRAAWSPNPEIAKTLIERGANVNAMDWTGRMALHEAVHRDFLDHVRTFKTIKLLIENGAKVNHKADPLRKNVSDVILHLALGHNHTDTVELLLQSKADVNMQDRLGWFPLHVAAIHKNPEFSKLCLQYGARVNEPGRHGWTPLHRALYRFNASTLAVLLDAGADPLIKDSDGLNAMELFLKTFTEKEAMKHKPEQCMACVKILLERGLLDPSSPMPEELKTVVVKTLLENSCCNNSPPVRPY